MFVSPASKIGSWTGVDATGCPFFSTGNAAEGVVSSIVAPRFSECHLTNILCSLSVAQHRFSGTTRAVVRNRIAFCTADVDCELYTRWDGQGQHDQITGATRGVRNIQPGQDSREILATAPENDIKLRM